MKSNQLRLLFIFFVLAGTSLVASTAWTSRTNLDTELIERGRYIAKIAGCNDCHTPGYLISDGNVPEEKWLSGDTFGWYGPWGTTYGPNLRLFVSAMSEDEWVQTAKTLKRLPPMPWFNLNAMKEQDLRALYQFMLSLGEPGEPAPAYLPPDHKPNSPYALFPSPPG